MRIYNYLESPEGYDFCGIPTVKPLSMYDVIPIEHRYFDESSYLAKTPSYVWYNSDSQLPPPKGEGLYPSGPNRGVPIPVR